MAISFFKYSQSFIRSAIRLTTISTSCTPSTIASIVSATLASVAEYPKGKPTTVATCICVGAKIEATLLTKGGGIQTAAKPYSTASMQHFSTSSIVVTGFNIV